MKQNLRKIFLKIWIKDYLKAVLRLELLLRELFLNGELSFEQLDRIRDTDYLGIDSRVHEDAQEIFEL